MKYKHTFICEYSKIERFNIYKAIKERLIDLGCFDMENIRNAMNEKTVNIANEIKCNIL